MHTKEDSVEIVKDPCHFPDPADIKKRKLRKTLKGRAVVSDGRPQKFNIAAWCGEFDAEKKKKKSKFR